MRSLEPFATKFGGLLTAAAAVFGAVFFGGQIGTTPRLAGESHLDLQAAKVAPVAGAVASRDAKPDSPTPSPQPNSPFQDFSAVEAVAIKLNLFSRPRPEMPERPDDRRTWLLVGVVELRI